MKSDVEFRQLGYMDARQGKPRYKFQDPHLQKLYDNGYDLFNEFQEAAGLPGRIEKVCHKCGAVGLHICRYQ